MMQHSEPLRLDRDGIVRHPNVHDARLEAISVQKPQACLKIVDVEGKHLDLVLQGVERLHASNFREGNIIFDITTGNDISALDRSELASLFGTEVERLKQAHFLEAISSRLANGELLFVRLVPSYGCSLIALCGQVSFQSN